MPIRLVGRTTSLWPVVDRHEHLRPLKVIGARPIGEDEWLQDVIDSAQPGGWSTKRLSKVADVARVQSEQLARSANQRERLLAVAWAFEDGVRVLRNRPLLRRSRSASSLTRESLATGSPA